MMVMPRPILFAAVGIVTRFGAMATIGSVGLLWPMPPATSLMLCSPLLGLAERDDFGRQRLDPVAIVRPCLHHQPARLDPLGIALVDVPDVAADHVAKGHLAVTFLVVVLDRPSGECRAESVNGEIGTTESILQEVVDRGVGHAPAGSSATTSGENEFALDAVGLLPSLHSVEYVHCSIVQRDDVILLGLLPHLVALLSHPVALLSRALLPRAHPQLVVPIDFFPLGRQGQLLAHGSQNEELDRICRQRAAGRAQVFAHMVAVMMPDSVAVDSELSSPAVESGASTCGRIDLREMRTATDLAAAVLRARLERASIVGRRPQPRHELASLLPRQRVVVLGDVEGFDLGKQELKRSL